MFGAEAKALFAKYFQKDKSQLSMFDKLFILVFVTNYPISWQLLMDIIFDYPLIAQSDTIWQAEKTHFLPYSWYFTFMQ